MSSLNTYNSLRGLVLSAVELKNLTNLPDAFIEDYLSIIRSLAAISLAVDRIKHSNLSDVLQADENSTDENLEKHITNLQANTWEIGAHTAANAMLVATTRTNKNERGDTQALNWIR